MVLWSSRHRYIDSILQISVIPVSERAAQELICTLLTCGPKKLLVVMSTSEIVEGASKFSYA